MTARNDVTGDRIRSKSNSQKYKDNWDMIFGKKDEDHVGDKLTDEEE